MANWTGFACWRALSLALGLNFASVESAGAVDLPPAPALPTVSSGAETVQRLVSAWRYRRRNSRRGRISDRPQFPLRRAPHPTGFPLSATPTLSTSGTIDAGVGYVFTPWARMDGTLEYRFGGRLQSDFAIADPAPFGSRSGCARAYPRSPRS